MEHRKRRATGHEGHACACGRPGHEPQSSRALGVLGERFARGEIDKAEYEEKRQIISGRSGLPAVSSATREEAPAPPAAKRRSGNR
jgi:hypothetical protein